MSTQHQRTCPSCGNEFSGTLEFCPVCMLRRVLAGGVESGESSFEEAAKPTPVQWLHRLEQYQLVMGEDVDPSSWPRGYGGHLQGVRHQSALPRDFESHQRAVPW